ncbi:hypothetical protein [Demequina pelophila]|uniref:hypothetical protein n=1 Tax=Demequina pelophila TaxID=1638984 RepID=UPI0007864D3A|nr:hypothetical protein [Demequina pelophila]
MARGFSYAPGASPEIEEAGRAGVTKERLTELGDSRNHLVRAAIARREDCPFGLMVRLVNDHHPEVRAALAGNTRLLGSVCEHLARDRSQDVLVALCGNPAAPLAVIDGLAMHRKRPVKAAAVEALEARQAVPAGKAGRAAVAPELRDRVAGTPEGQADRAPEREHPASPGESEALASVGVRAEAPAGAGAAGHAAAQDPPARPRPTRTAPVRGFRPPSEAS